MFLHQQFVHDFSGWHQHFDGLLEGHNRQHILITEQVDHIAAGAFDILHRCALHRAAAVDHEAEVERGASRGGLSVGDLDEQPLARDAVRQGDGSPSTGVMVRARVGGTPNPGTACVRLKSTGIPIACVRFGSG